MKPDLSVVYLTAKAPVLDVPGSQVKLITDHSNGDRRSFHLHVSTPEGVSLVAGSISSTSPIAAITLAGTPIPDPNTLASRRTPWVEQKFQYRAPPAEGFDVIVEVGQPGRFTLSISDHRYGLPQVPGFTTRERPADRMPLAREFLPNSKTDRVLVSGSFVFGL